MSSYTYVQAQSGTVEDTHTGVTLDVDIVAQVPLGYNVSQDVLDRAVERALDYIFDGGIEDD